MVEKAPDIDTPETEAAKAERKRQDAYDSRNHKEAARQNMLAALYREREGYVARRDAAPKDSDEAEKWTGRVAQVDAQIEHYDGEVPKQAKSARSAQQQTRA